MTQVLLKLAGHVQMPKAIWLEHRALWLNITNLIYKYKYKYSTSKPQLPTTSFAPSNCVPTHNFIHPLLFLSNKLIIMSLSPVCQLFKPTYPVMFCMETLLERETHCWDRLLVNIGTAVASSGKRTADLGRSLGCEAAREERTWIEASPFQIPSADLFHRCHKDTKCFQYISSLKKKDLKTGVFTSLAVLELRDPPKCWD